jgi:hypothetical protein
VNEGATMLASGTGAMAGALAGAPLGPIGMIAGGILGAGFGGASAEAGRQVYGRAAGTNQMTPEQAMEEVAWEGLGNMAGQGVASGLGLGVKGLTWAAKQMAPGTSAVIADAFGQMTGAGSRAMRTLLAQPQKTWAYMQSTLKRAGAVDKAQDIAANEARRATEVMLRATDHKVTSEYARGVANLGIAAQKNGKALDIGQAGLEALDGFSQEGVGRMVLAPGGKGLTFQPTTINNAPGILKAGQKATPLATPEAQKTAQEIAEFFQEVGQQGQVTGKAGADLLVKYEQFFNKLRRSKLSAEQEIVVEKAATAWKNAVSKTFDQAGLAGEYTKLAQPYTRMGNIVRHGRRILDQDVAVGTQTLSKKAVSGGGKYSLEKDMVDEMTDYLGQRGQVIRGRLEIAHAAEKLLPKGSKLGLIPAGSAIVGASAVGGPIAGAAMTGAVAQTSPRFVAKEVAYAAKGVEFLRSLDRSGMASFLRDSNAVESFFREIGSQTLQEKAETEDLLKQTGVKGQ